VLAHEIRHAYFASMNRDAHRRNRAQKRSCGKYENKQRHSQRPLQPLLEPGKKGLAARRRRDTAFVSSIDELWFFAHYPSEPLYFLPKEGAEKWANLSLLVSARFTPSSKKRGKEQITVVAPPPRRFVTGGSFPAAIRSFRSARTSSSLNTAPRTSSS